MKDLEIPRHHPRSQIVGIDSAIRSSSSDDRLSKPYEIRSIRSWPSDDSLHIERSLMSTTPIHWAGGTPTEAVELLSGAGGIAVVPTKVGYIIMTSDRRGLDRKFDAKERHRNKPGVVLVSSLDMLRELAQLTPEIDSLYERCWNEDVLLGCILPWSDAGKKAIPSDGSHQLMMDARGTSCFVIKFGVPAENVARQLYEDHGKIAFASSANPSGQGNRGLVEGIGDRITEAADVIIEADDYVASIQPDTSVDTRYEQGVMVSMVDPSGALVPEQNGQRSIAPCPTLIRKGLAVDRIMMLLADSFTSWDYRQGEYY
ncbi:L-threonylcarbamoyladenylate synthase [Plantibacter flavus]|uniref:L-threonylcarbamoyladenylate synthase n=2 Tax=Microbacteriaceae TaxID=85023 RepID=UPI001F018EAA|nr:MULTISPECIES: Sua5/YciO/YrdC/YwlC family protein [Plantibacter]